MGDEQMSTVSIITYHGLSLPKNEADENGYNIPVEDFERQIRWLKEKGYVNASFTSYLHDRRVTAEQGKKVLITFDDGEKSNFTHACPLLEQYGYLAVLFITTGIVQTNREFLSWHQVKQLSDRGHVIQSHGHTHRFLSSMEDEEIFCELRLSRDLIERYTGKRPEAFSCPGGRYDRRVMRIARELGYRKMFTSRPMSALFLQQGYAAGRTMIHQGMGDSAFAAGVRGDAWYLLSQNVTYMMKGIARSFVGENRYQQLFNMYHLWRSMGKK